MRLALAAALLALTLTAAVPAHGDPLTTQVTGAGIGTATLGTCQDTDVPIAFHLSFTGGESPVLFPNPGCEGWVNAFVNDCRQEASGIVCDGSYEDEGFLSISRDGDFHYERALDGVAFSVDGQVAFNEVVVPAFV